MLQGKWESQASPHQPSGNASGGKSPSGILFSSSCHSSSVLRQLHSHLLLKQGGGTNFFSLWKETELVFQLVINFLISIQAVHIVGKMNVIADLLSCQD